MIKPRILLRIAAWLAGSAAMAIGGPALALLSFAVTPGPYSLPIGTTQTLRIVASGTDNDVRTVTLEAIGGCGAFGTATRVDVPLAYDAVTLSASAFAPAFTTKAAGFCTYRLSANGKQSDTPLTVFDPATLKLVPGFALVAVAFDDSTTDVDSTVMDAGGHPAANQVVTYSLDGACASFYQGATENVASSDVNGRARPTRAYYAKRIAGYCPMTARLLSNGYTAKLDGYVFDPRHVHVKAAAVLSTTVNEPLLVSLKLTDEGGTALPRVSVFMRPGAAIPGGATCGRFSVTTPYTDQRGNFANVCQAGTIPGYYDILVDVARTEVRIPVVQTIGSQPPPPLPVRTSRHLQDMWWGGTTQNGWGVSVVQHGDTLFVVIYGYDSKGQPQWYVMPGGRWNERNLTYTGPMYVPHGSPFYAYNSAAFDVGEWVGTASITFFDDDEAVLDVSYPSVGTKLLTRQFFGSGTANTSYGDMWWGGAAQDGWGIAILQQGSALFSVWFTYDAQGAARWYVMPAGSWTAPDSYEGRVYRTTSDFDWFGNYDATRLKVTDAGQFRFHFGGDTASFEYGVDGSTGVLQLVRQPF